MIFETTVCWQQFAFVSFLFQLYNVPMSQELDWPAQSPDLNPVPQLGSNCKPELISQQQCQTSTMLFWLNGSKSLQPGAKKKKSCVWPWSAAIDVHTFSFFPKGKCGCKIYFLKPDICLRPLPGLHLAHTDTYLLSETGILPLSTHAGVAALSDCGKACWVWNFMLSLKRVSIEDFFEGSWHPEALRRSENLRINTEVSLSAFAVGLFTAHSEFDPNLKDQVKRLCQDAFIEQTLGWNLQKNDSDAIDLRMLTDNVTATLYWRTENLKPKSFHSCQSHCFFFFFFNLWHEEECN